jgi:hypothetical protein
MIPRFPRASRLPARLILVTGLLGAVLAPGSAPATGLVAAIAGVPSSLSARYGAAVDLGSVAPGRYLIPTRTGFEIRDASQASADSLIATFRLAGRIDEAVLLGSTAWLAAGMRGLIAVDLTNPAAPLLVGSHGGLGAIRHVAAAPASQTLVAASDSALFFFRVTGAGSLSLLESRTWSDSRSPQQVEARNDSILVAFVRTGVLPRLFVTLFRVPVGAPPESLWDFQANFHQALDLSWEGRTAFLADGDNGIQPFDLPTRQLRPAKKFSAPQFVQALDADDSVVVALGGNRRLARFRRSGSYGDSLTDESGVALPLNPVRIGLVDGHAIISSDSEAERQEPEEVAQSVLQDHDLTTGVTGPAQGATGRVRRVVQSAGLAYAAEYTGGLRIYRAGSADSSLVGALPPSSAYRVYDIGLDAGRGIAYLAAGVAGVEVVDVSNPAAPAQVALVALPGITRCVAVIGDTLLAAGWNAQPINSGVTFVNVSNPGAPLLRGSISSGPDATLSDPRALASRDTVLYVADDLSGVVSVTFRYPDAPGIRGVPSGVVGTRDVRVSGTVLLAATRSRGLQIVDATNPVAPLWRSELPLPAVLGVAVQGTAAVAFLGEEGAAVVDFANPSAPVTRGDVASPGIPRGGAWAGDTLLVASSLGLERFLLPASLPAEPALNLSFDDSGARPRVLASWMPVTLPGLAGLNVYREIVSSGAGSSPLAVRVNGPLLAPDAVSFADSSIQSSGTLRYRLEAAINDGSAREVAVGTISVSFLAGMGRPFPNPFRPGSAGPLTIPYRSGPMTASAPVQVRVFDVRGRLVRSIRSSVPPSGGTAWVLWDGRDERGVPAASGLYVVHVRAPGIDDARSVVLLR